MARSICTVEDCGNFVQARGFCPNHYQRWRRNGHPTVEGRKRVTVLSDGRRNCTKCDAIKLPAAFGKHRLGVGGLSAWCRVCMANAYRSAAQSDLAAYRSRKADREATRRAATFGPDADSTITRAALRDRDGDACAYCGTVMDFSTHTRSSRPFNAASVDHILPLSRGGAHAWDNVALCCMGCNLRKGDRPAPQAIASERNPS